MMRRALAAMLWLAGAAYGQCARCHRAETARFDAGAMTHALSRIDPTRRLAGTVGGYRYEIADGEYRVSRSEETLRARIAYVFGRGTGETFVYQRDGQWYESRVSYFGSIDGLDLTLGANANPRNLVEAAGRTAAASEMRQCFGCHAAGVPKGPELNLARMVEGVQCERCHGAVEAHSRGGAVPQKLGALTTEALSDFCGQCHRTWEQIAANGPHGIENIRFQPYRLAGSRCYDAADRRIRCTACHDPHGPLETMASAYDQKCLACHASNAKVKACRVATADCVTCHMPKLELPGAHRKFTDHRIRIARAGERYPE